MDNHKKHSGFYEKFLLVQLLMEQLVLSNKKRFGTSSEKMDMENQIRFFEKDGIIVFFNESEAVCDLEIEEPETLETKSVRKKKRIGKKEEDLSGIPVTIITHYLSEKELTAEFSENGWKQLPDAIAKRYHFTQAKVEVEEHHIGVYAGKIVLKNKRLEAFSFSLLVT